MVVIFGVSSNAAWQEHAKIIIQMIDEMSISPSSSLSLTLSGSLSRDFDNDDDNNNLLIHEVFASLVKQQSTIANKLPQTIAQFDIVWHTNNGLAIEELSEDDTLLFLRFSKVHLQIVAHKLWPQLVPYLLGEKGLIKFDFGHFHTTGMRLSSL